MKVLLQPLQMSAVQSCGVEECAFNRLMACHAKAITIGDGDNPRCDTFFKNGKHSAAQMMAEVGACKVASCAFNQDFLCSAGKIEVDRGSDMADCMTYSQR